MNEKLIELSQKFWKAMETADEVGMRAVADPNCNFVHIGMTCKLEQEIGAYTSGMFKPTEIKFNRQTSEVFGDTGIVLTDCNYTLLLGGQPTTHHFAVTEVFTKQGEDWKLVTFTFTALVY